MKITNGLFSRMVLQRGARNQCEVEVTGTTNAEGAVAFRIDRSAWKPAGRAGRGKFKARLTGLRTGGPYTITVAVREGRKLLDSVTVRDVLVGDVWIAAGQSNMQGCGRREHADRPHPMVRAFYMDDRWKVARDPIHNMWDCVDPVHIELCGGVRPGKDLVGGVGPAVGFAQEMHRRTGVPQGMLACAHGGTSMTHWDPGRRDEGGHSLYGATVRRLKKNGGAVSGVIWYQGESDADPASAPLYTDRMKQLIRAFRRDTRNPQLPFVLVQLSRHVGPPDAGRCDPWNSIQDQQRCLPEKMRNLATVPGVDLPLDDGIHIGGPGPTRLGKRLADAMDHLCRGRGRGPIRVKSAAAVREPVRGSGDAVVQFENVSGRLACGSRPTGFVILDENGVVPAVYDVQLERDRAIVRTHLSPADLGEHWIAYGHGRDPVCNITDSADRSLPVFTALPLGKPRAVTPHVRHWEISRFVDADPRLKRLALPKPTPRGFWSERTFETDHANLHLEITASGTHSQAVFYRCRFHAAEPMKLAALIGYDGPVTVWIDGRKRFTDPHGTNPAMMEEQSVRFNASRGRHEIVIALGDNGKRAWGIFLRFHRLDVTPAQIKAGLPKKALPRFK